MTYPHHGHERGSESGQQVPVWAVELYNDVRGVQSHVGRLDNNLFELNQKLESLMADFTQAAHDAEALLQAQNDQIASLTASVSDLQAKLSASPSVDPAVQAAADELEAKVQALQPAPAAPADGGTPPADGSVPADGSAPVDPTAPAVDPNAPQDTPPAA